MFRSTTELEQLYLTADLRTLEARGTHKLGCGLFDSQLQRFPPIEDVVAELDRTASRTIAA